MPRVQQSFVDFLQSYEVSPLLGQSASNAAIWIARAPIERLAGVIMHSSSFPVAHLLGRMQSYASDHCRVERKVNTSIYRDSPSNI